MRIVDLAPTSPLWPAALKVLRELRPHLTLHDLEALWADDLTPPTFTAILDDAQSPDDDAPAVLGVAGWRVITNTSAGRKLYVDDLVTAGTHRSRGVGTALLAHLMDRARNLACATLDLDSGVERTDAHRFYLREGMYVSSHHFRMTVDREGPSAT